LSYVENVEPEADERRVHKEIVLLTINNRKTRSWVVARLQPRAVENCSIEISLCGMDWREMQTPYSSCASLVHAATRCYTLLHAATGLYPCIPACYRLVSRLVTGLYPRLLHACIPACYTLVSQLVFQLNLVWACPALRGPGPIFGRVDIGVTRAGRRRRGT
jgi:hypothetical protein